MSPSDPPREFADCPDRSVQAWLFSAGVEAEMSCCRIFVQRSTSFSSLPPVVGKEWLLGSWEPLGAVCKTDRIAAEMLVSKLENSLAASLRGASRRIAPRRPSARRLFVQSRDRIGTTRLSLSRALLQLCAHRANLRERVEAPIHASTEALSISNASKIRGQVLMRGPSSQRAAENKLFPSTVSFTV